MDNNYLSDEKTNKVLETTIGQLDLMVSTYNCLNRAKIKTVADIVNYGEKGLLRVRNLGKCHLIDIKEKLQLLGINI